MFEPWKQAFPPQIIQVLLFVITVRPTQRLASARVKASIDMLQPSLLLYLSSRPTWRDRSRARRSLLYSLVFRLLDLIQLGLNVSQCPEDLPPRFVFILQALLSLRMMRAV